MPVFKGTTATTAIGAAYDIPSYIGYYSLVNTTGGNITVDVGIFLGSTITYILKGHSVTTADPHFHETGARILIPIGYQIYVAASGSCDYYFVIDG